MNTTTPSPNYIHRSLARSVWLLVSLLIACFGFLPNAQAVSPPPDGGYPNNNTAEGDNALFSLTTGNNNTAVGFNALFSATWCVDNTAVGSAALSNGTGGTFNTAIGASALFNNSGGNNTAIGVFALNNNTYGGANTATGANALSGNTSGGNNTATGADALPLNATGANNTADGNQALRNNISGSFNTATGANALYSLTSGGNNTATGVRALGGNSIRNTGSFNTATGVDALNKNTMGHRNTANGVQALFNNTTGFKNSASGVYSLFYNTIGHDNIAVGNAALQYNTTGSFNIAVGSNAGGSLTTGSDNIDIGAVGVAGESDTMRIGTVHQTSTFISGIYGAAIPGGVGVIIDSTGHLGTLLSSKRFKDGIKPIEKASEAILALKPVTFRYKRELDPHGIPQFGLIAEDVEKVNPDLVVRDAEGKVYTVRYEAVNAMLLNEFLKEHHRVQALEEQVEELTASLQKVSAQIELSKTESQTVSNSE
jgi:hypothetical protein